MSKLHIVLVHGAYHRPWHLGLLKSKLEEAGLQVSAPALPSAGDNVPPTIGVKEDKEAIKSAIEEAAETADRILPVFHSYGGIPGSEAVAELSPAARDKIVRLLYLMAFVIDQGTALTTPTGGKTAPWSVRNGDILSVPDPIPVFYNDVSSDLAQAAAGKVVKHSYRAFADKTEHAGWKMYPATYLLCTKDMALPLNRVRERLDVLKEASPHGFEVLEMESGHSPFLSKVEETAALIRRLAGVL